MQHPPPVGPPVGPRVGVVVGSAPEEDDLDRYRHAVERVLGADLVLDDEADIEAFFEFVIACYDAGEAPSDCARRWLGEAREGRNPGGARKVSTTAGQA